MKRVFSCVTLGRTSGAAQKEDHFTGRTAREQVGSGAREGRGADAEPQVDEVGGEIQT